MRGPDHRDGDSVRAHGTGDEGAETSGEASGEASGETTPAKAGDDGPGRTRPGRPPVARLAVAGGVGLEALLVAVLGVGVGVTSATGSARDRLGAAVLAVTALALAAGLAAVAAGVLRGAAWSRSPTLVWQAIQIAIGALNLPPAAGVPLVVLSVAVGYGVLRRDVVPPREVTPPR